MKFTSEVVDIYKDDFSCSMHIFSRRMLVLQVTYLLTLLLYFRNYLSRFSRLK